MGNSQLKEPASTTKNQFEFQYIIGHGGYSKVWKVSHKPSRSNFAMKEMKKALIVSKRSVHSVLNERKLLAIIKHPFIVNMQFAFQDTHNLYLAMDLMDGGDLRFHLCRRRVFSEEETRFLAACIVTALEYLHINNIIHRDIKPENLVFDSRGYIRVTDFGIARELSGRNANEASGTPGYMAPEVMNRQTHGITVDYFGLGVIIYECMKGYRPYQGRTKREIRDSMISKQVVLKRADVPHGWSLEAADFVNKLLARKPNERLGAKGPLEVKNHAWLQDFPWKRLFEKRFDAPFKPPCGESYHERTDIVEDCIPNLPNQGYQELFAGYLFHNGLRDSGYQASTVKI